MRYKYALIAFLISLSCSVGKNKKHDQIEPIIVQNSEPKIFEVSDEEIIFEIKQMLFSDTSTFEVLTHKSILLNLYCDTNSCSVDSILIEGTDEVPEYSNRIIDYFKKMSPINCYDDRYKKKFSQYDILIADWGGGLFLTIGHGYRPY